MSSNEIKQEKKSYPTFLQSVILIICIHLLFLFFHFLIKITAASTLNNQETTIPELVYQILYLVTITTVLLYARFKSGITIISLFTLRTDLIKTWFAIAVLVVGSSIVLSEGENLARSLCNVAFPEKDSPLFTKTVTGFLTGCIFAPFLEEILFRGIIVRGFLNRYNAAFTIFLSSVVFAIAYTDPLQMIGAFLFGLFLSWITIQSGSVITAIWAHISVNVLSFVLSLDLLPYIEGFSPLTEDLKPGIHHQPFLFTITGIVLTASSFWYLIKNSRKILK